MGTVFEISCLYYQKATSSFTTGVPIGSDPNVMHPLATVHSIVNAKCAVLTIAVILQHTLYIYSSIDSKQ